MDATANPDGAATRAGNRGTASPAGRQTMLAVVQETYGTADVWGIEEIARPLPAGSAPG